MITLPDLATSHPRHHTGPVSYRGVRGESGAPPHDPTLLHRALNYLAAACDGARRRDGCGFSAFDSAFGKSLAASDPSRWSSRTAAAAFKLALKYRRQLNAVGLSLDCIAASGS